MEPIAVAVVAGPVKLEMPDRLAEEFGAAVVAAVSLEIAAAAV